MHSEDDCEERRLAWAEAGEHRGAIANHELFGNSLTSCGLFFLQCSDGSPEQQICKYTLYVKVLRRWGMK